MSHFIIIPDSVRVLFEKGTYFGNDSIYALPGKPVLGADGTILPYAMQQDLVITLLLTLSFLVLCYILSKGAPFILQQLKEFFQERERNNMFVENGNEFGYLIVLVIHTALMVGLLLFSLRFQFLFPDFLYPSWQIIGWGFLACLCLYLFKYTIYSLVNWAFFYKDKCRRWIEINILLIALQGVLFFPIICLSVYTGLSTQIVLYYTLFIVIFAKILQFYKGYCIFFTNLQGLLYNILYFCTLETIPLLILWKVLQEIR